MRLEDVDAFKKKYQDQLNNFKNSFKNDLIRVIK